MNHMASAGPLLKTTLFTVFVPGVAAGYLPWRIGQASSGDASNPEKWAAMAIILLGAAIYASTAFWGFAITGGGTPAPIAPTKRLVVAGLHRFVRNPMYIGVSLVIAGQAWLHHSPRVALYLVVFVSLVHMFVVFYEEPTLQKQFGQEYERYRATVPRWIPRFRHHDSSVP